MTPDQLTDLRKNLEAVLYVAVINKGPTNKPTTGPLDGLQVAALVCGALVGLLDKLNGKPETSYASTLDQFLGQCFRLSHAPEMAELIETMKSEGRFPLAG